MRSLADSEFLQPRAKLPPADPLSADGTRYLAEAAQLFGEGTVPAETTPDPSDSTGWLVLAVVTGLVAGALAIGFVAWQRGHTGGDA